MTVAKIDHDLVMYNQSLDHYVKCCSYSWMICSIRLHVPFQTSLAFPARKFLLCRCSARRNIVLLLHIFRDHAIRLCDGLKDDEPRVWWSLRLLVLACSCVFSPLWGRSDLRLACSCFVPRRASRLSSCPSSRLPTEPPDPQQARSRTLCLPLRLLPRRRRKPARMPILPCRILSFGAIQE
jgi:hypothetical protein